MSFGAIVDACYELGARTPQDSVTSTELVSPYFSRDWVNRVVHRVRYGVRVPQSSSEFILVELPSAELEPPCAIEVDVESPVLTEMNCIPPDARVVAFDTETSGWIKGNTASNLVIQMAWVVFDAAGNVLKSSEKYCLLPDGDVITPMALGVHKIRIETIRQFGVDTRAELESFCDFVAATSRAGVKVVAHNAAFDVQAINRTLKRWDSPMRLDEWRVFCTMRSSGVFLGLKGPSGRARNPKNSELYQILFDSVPEGILHGALVDCKITGKNYLGGVCKHWWL